MNGGTLVGTLRSWKEPWGFITCPSFEGDLFAHREHVVDGVGSVPVGDLTGASVQFERATDEKGRSHAARIVVLNYGQNSSRLLQQQMHQQVMQPPPPRQRHSPHTMPPAPMPPGYGAPLQNRGRAPPSTSSGAGAAHLAGQRMRGEIRSWKGQWGFLVCPAKFLGDVFVHQQHMDVAEPANGKQVSFTINTDDKGRCCATEVTEPSPAAEDFVGLGTITGEVRSWKKDWGFITSPSFMGDLFCHQDSLQFTSEPTPPTDQLAQVLVNRPVTFEVLIDKKNRTCATQVVPDEAWKPPSTAASSRSASIVARDGAGQADESSIDPEVLYGTVRNWRDKWGFITCPETFEGDLFVHKDMFVEAVPPADLSGASVQFQRAVDKKGRNHAAKVKVLSWPSGDAKPPPPPPKNIRPMPVAPAPVAWPAQMASNGQHVQYHSQPAAQESSLPIVEHKVQGTVRSWKSEWGFLTSPQFEGDLFAHKGNLGGITFLANGANVTFDIATDNKQRKTAVNLTCTSSAEDYAGTNQQLQGHIRTWKNPWGFIVAPGAFQGDVFAHSQHFAFGLPPDFGVGMEVSFTVERDDAGRLGARNINIVVPRALQAGMKRPLNAMPVAFVAGPPPGKRPRAGKGW